MSKSMRSTLQVVRVFKYHFMAQSWQFAGDERLLVSGIIHGQDDGLHDAGSSKCSMRLPLIAARAVPVVADATHCHEVVSAITLDALNSRVQFRVKCDRPVLGRKLLPAALVLGYLTTRGHGT
jgi:hypothetical protein